MNFSIWQDESPFSPGGKEKMAACHLRLERSYELRSKQWLAILTWREAMS